MTEKNQTAACHPPMADSEWTEWVEFEALTSQRLRCCDCGLVHEFDFRTDGARLQFRARRRDDLKEAA